MCNCFWLAFRNYLNSRVSALCFPYFFFILVILANWLSDYFQLFFAVCSCDVLLHLCPLLMGRLRALKYVYPCHIQYLPVPSYELEFRDFLWLLSVIFAFCLLLYQVRPLDKCLRRIILYLFILKKTIQLLIFQAYTGKKHVEL